MKRYLITVRIMSRAGAPTQLVMAEHSAKNLAELADILNNNDFIIVRQLHKDGQGKLEFGGETLLNTEAVGKVREMLDRPCDD